MTAYTDFTRDFPQRCLDVLDAASAGAATNGREITLLLMTASVGLLVPFERLKPEHPFGDGRQYELLADRFSDLLENKFVGSVLCPSDNHSWYIARNVASVDGALDNWLHFVRAWIGFLQVASNETRDKP